ncbi:ABC-F family ATP-binding cassette domain-containing protein [Schaalia sp. JY-X169]|uniref:ABC-F family ATP-binding cassette domain-containing protein n=1 Tax=Schaalia sp. JY-X169 TaxID=2758572 RepID=UPI0015F741B9|nr:ABC-F family ATP-binding cassette domain-containing protein [Schaalia sp. JY-X169]
MTPQNSRTHLRVDGISKSFPDRRVLTDVSLTVSAGEVVGLIGENGSGKTTLLKIIAGLLEADSGTVSAEGAGFTPTFGLLHQEPPFSPNATVLEALEDAVRPSRAAEHELSEAATDLATHPESSQAENRYADALHEAERLDIWTLDSRISATLSALGLDSVPTSRPTHALSGGQKARLSLAWLLLSKPEVLLLDEPTNHLDDAAITFLRDSLATWQGPVLFASHDRAFLDEAASVLIDLDPAPRPHTLVRDRQDGGLSSGLGVTRFSGNYSEYLTHRQAERERWERRFREEQAELKRLRSSVKSSHTVGHADWSPRTESRIAKKFYGDRNAKVVSRRVSDAERRLADLEEDQIAKPPRQLQFSGLGAPTGADVERSAVAASGITVAGRLCEVSFSLSKGEHLLVTGANGSGKSTLLAVLAGNLQPTAGSVTLPTGGNKPGSRSKPRSHSRPGGRGTVGLLSQHVLIADPNDRGQGRTAAQAYADIVGEGLAEAIPLSYFGLLEPRDLSRPLSSLSVGQQRRVQLAGLLAVPPELLLLDEPTNHLSLALATALEADIPHYPGSVIIASHDRWLRQRWHGKTLNLDGKP